MEVAAIRLAEAHENGLVQTISSSAYIPAYRHIIEAAPLPAYEDYTDRILKGNVWVAEIKGEACGVLVLEKGSSFIFIYSIAVDPRWQGKGIGRILLKHAEKYARDRQLSQIRLYTNTRMERNLALYLSFGFVVTGERDHPTRQGQTLVDMIKDVGSESH